MVLALLSDGTVRAWGSNIDSELGVHGSKSRCQCVPRPILVKRLKNVAAISAGSTHNLALLVNGTVRGWGDASNGELGSGTGSVSAIPRPVSGLAGKFTAVSAGSSFSLALS
jgi:alpha-tubulin suppressor-like RCC1 family protein